MDKRVIFAQAAALPAGGAADRGHAGLLLLARGAGDLAVGPAARTPFGGNSQFVWFENFAALFADPRLPRTRSASPRCSASLVAVIGLALSLLLAVMADRVIRGAAPTRRF